MNYLKKLFFRARLGNIYDFEKYIKELYMFFYNLIIIGFVILCLLMILLILMQKGKSSMGLGGLGGGTQLLFGGSGGQDLFQKATWVMGALFMGGSLILATLKPRTESKLLGEIAQHQSEPMPQSTPPGPR